MFSELSISRIAKLANYLFVKASTDVQDGLGHTPVKEARRQHQGYVYYSTNREPQ